MKKTIVILLAFSMMISFAVRGVAEDNQAVDLSSYSFQQLVALRQQIDAQLTQIATNVDHSGYSLDGLVYVSNGSEIRINLYEGTNPEVIIPTEIDGLPVTQIHPNAFKGNKTITSVVLPEGITEIPEEFFRGCDKLKNVKIPNTIEKINRLAFFDTHLNGVILFPSSLTSIGSEAFVWCDVNGIIIQNDIEIDYNAFNYNDNMVFLYLKDNVERFDGESLRAKNLEMAILPASLISIGDNIFEDCNRLVIVCPAGSYAESYAKQHFIMCDTEHYDQYVQEYDAKYLNNY